MASVSKQQLFQVEAQPRLGASDGTFIERGTLLTDFQFPGRMLSIFEHVRATL